VEQPLLQALFEDTEPRPLTVSELNAEVRALVERGFASVWVEGEVVDFKKYSSGHWYFSLNDGDAQVKCVCFRGTNFRIRFRPENGVTVRVRGRITFWEARGELKLQVESLEPAGEGALRAAFEQIKTRLEREGLFAEEIKRPIPFFPRRVGVVTSDSGAAFHDIVTVLARRARSVSIVLAPAHVQGEGAADSLRRAVNALNRYNSTLTVTERIDVLIIGRGGGSAEDLWAFNDEALARAIRASEIPVISAVGHEIDWTIADLIADLRAATPSAAAEIVAAREEDILATLRSSEERLIGLISHRVADARSATEGASSELSGRFAFVVQAADSRLSGISSRLSPLVLRASVAGLNNRVESLDQRRRVAMDRGMKTRGEGLAVCVAKLDALSPLGVLTRGYSITEGEDGRIIRDASTVARGDKLKIRLERGKLNAEVLSSEKNDG
jgi:exodeoxyribonuclease VII large subunit